MQVKLLLLLLLLLLLYTAARKTKSQNEMTQFIHPFISVEMEDVKFQDSTSGSVVRRACPGETCGKRADRKKKNLWQGNFESGRNESMIIYSKDDSKASIHTRGGA
jgi:hypothetical protein